MNMPTNPIKEAEKSLKSLTPKGTKFVDYLKKSI